MNKDAHISTTREEDGDIVPAYVGPNAPVYPRGEGKDTEIPHEQPVFVAGSSALEGVKPEIPQNIRDIIDQGRADGTIDARRTWQKNRPLPRRYS